MVKLVDNLVAFPGAVRSEKLLILDAETFKNLRANEIEAGAHLTENQRSVTNN